MTFFNDWIFKNFEYSFENFEKLGDLQKNIYKVIVKRFIAVFYPPAEYNKVNIEVIVDDTESFYASGRVCTNIGYLEVLRQTLENYGIPISLYPDKYSVFFPPKKVDDHITIEEQLNGREKGVTQFGIIVEKPGINMFPAPSPQASKKEHMWIWIQFGPTDNKHSPKLG